MGQDTHPPGHTPGTSTTEPEPVTFEAIYRNHARWVWGTVRRLGVAESWCADATQEVFVVVLRRLPEYKPRHRLRGWLGAIALKVAATFRRREGRAPSLPLPGRSIEAAERSGEILAADTELEIARGDELQRVLDDLHPDQRLLLLLHHRDEVPLDEIAEHLGVAENTIKTRLRRARQAYEAAWKRLQAREHRLSGANVLPLFGPWKLLEADRQPPPVPDGALEKVWENLQQMRGIGGGSGGPGPTPPPGPAPGLPSALAGLPGTVAVTVGTLGAVAAAGASLAAGGFLVGLVVGLTWGRPVAPTAPIPSGLQLVALAPPPTAATAAPSAAPSATAAAAASLAPSADTASNLEDVWMDAANDAAAAGNLPAALKALQEHATRYHGGGQRAQERETVWIRVLLRAGRIGEARAHFAPFERLYPQNPSLPKFREKLAAP